MNKKFSTLLCASLLVSSAFTVNAADITPAAGVSLAGANAYAVPGFLTTTPAGVYQLRDNNGTLDNLADDKVLAVVEESDQLVYKMVAPGAVDVKSTLWCVQISAQASQGQEAIYDFVNKATGAILAFDQVNSELTGDAFGGWAFSPTWKTDDKGTVRLQSQYPLYTHMETDYVMALYKEGDYVKGAKILTTVADKLRDAANSTFTDGTATRTALKLTIFDAGTYLLSAAEINAYLKDNKSVLTFAPDSKGQDNQFTKNELVALGLDQTADNTDHNFVYVTKKSAEKQYLKVDTAANSTGTQFLELAWTDTEKDGSKDALVRTDEKSIADQHKFLFIYKPSGDSLFIQVKQARYKNEKNPEDYWFQATDVRNYGDTYLGLPVDLKDDQTALGAEAASLFVKLQNFTIAESVVTIGERPINTKIGYGVDGCFATSDKISLDNGVYVIYNAKGQVLAAPIHLNDDKGTNKAQWVTLDEQDPLHMPAYQWVITKTISADKAKASSPVKIVNREFTSLTVSSLQLRTNDKKEVVVSSLVLGNIDLNKATFDQIKDAKILGDKKLGYRYIPTDSLQVNKYVFNYLNPFTADYWIANGSDKDSVMYVKEDAARYNLKEGSTSSYGITVDKDLLKLIPGLAQLERTNYLINMPNSKKYLAEAYNEKYSMGLTNNDIEPYAVDTFFFKENNHWEGKHFYAIVESTPTWKNGTEWTGAVINNAKNGANYNDATHKVGTADDGKSAVLKVQLLNETRTSAFTVEPDQTPLYRRFNNVALGESATDAADSLIFVEKIRKEYLMDESNKNLLDENVDYAGIWNKEKAEGKLVFHVDTAWVNRGLGYIKPQYLISVARADQDLNIVTQPCTEGTPHIKADGTPTDDPYECVHATHKKLGFAYGKYLVNFSDSVARNSVKDNNFKKPYMDIDGGYTRVGFVEAIKVGDSLVILTNGFEKVEPAKIDTAKIFKFYKDNKLTNNIINLKGDGHKNVTWSFRYVSPDKAMAAYADGVEGDNNEFLFESNIYDEDGDAVSGSTNAGKATLTNFAKAVKGSIAPSYAAWLKMQNGCLVLTRGDSKFDAAKTGSDGALIFNAQRPTPEDEYVTSNDNINNVEGVSVVAGNGTVTVQGAAGKSVVITNILGKVVAETVLTSDNATIAVPAGIVAVAVDGEEAVKTIVK